MSKEQERSQTTKADKIKALLLRSNGATLAELAKSTNWQPHSVRGFMSGTLKKKLNLQIESSREDGKPRRYFIERGVK